jgi:hypothetical protein
MKSYREELWFHSLLRARALVPWGLWALFVFRGLVYLSMTPVWEGFDEHQHYAYVQLVAERGRLPIPGRDAVSLEVEASLRLLPLPWELKDSGIGLTHEKYWRLGEGERRARQDALRRIPPGARREPAGTANPHLLLYEAQQPPLYYLLAAGPYRLFQGTGLLARVFILRLFSVLLASAAIPLLFLTARRVLGDQSMAAWTTAAAVCMPELMMDVVRVGNDALAVCLISFLVWLSLEWEALSVRRCLALGLLLGAGLLTKAFFYPVVPALVLLAAVRSRKNGLDWRVSVGRAGLLLAACAAVSGLWFARNMALTGTLTGVMQSVALGGKPFLDYLRAITRVDWYSAVDSLLVSHIWFGNWSFLGLRAWIYKAFMLLYLLAAAGLAGWVPAWRNRQGEAAVIPGGAALVLVNYLGWFWLGLLYHVLITWMASGQSSSAGWYLYCLVVPEAILLVAGLCRWVPAGSRLRVPALLCGLFVLLDLCGMVLVMIPYYTGQIVHRTAGHAVTSFQLLRLTGTQAGEMLGRLAVNRFPHLAPDWYGILLGTYLLVSVAVLAFAGRRLARRS